MCPHLSAAIRRHVKRKDRVTGLIPSYRTKMAVSPEGERHAYLPCALARPVGVVGASGR